MELKALQSGTLSRWLAVPGDVLEGFAAVAEYVCPDGLVCEVAVPSGGVLLLEQVVQVGESFDAGATIGRCVVPGLPAAIGFDPAPAAVLLRPLKRSLYNHIADRCRVDYDDDIELEELCLEEEDATVKSLDVPEYLPQSVTFREFLRFRELEPSALEVRGSVRHSFRLPPYLKESIADYPNFLFDRLELMATQSDLLECALYWLFSLPADDLRSAVADSHQRQKSGHFGSAAGARPDLDAFRKSA